MLSSSTWFVQFCLEKVFYSLITDNTVTFSK